MTNPTTPTLVTLASFYKEPSAVYNAIQYFTGLLQKWQLTPDPHEPKPECFIISDASDRNHGKNGGVLTSIAILADRAILTRDRIIEHTDSNSLEFLAALQGLKSAKNALGKRPLRRAELHLDNVDAIEQLGGFQGNSEKPKELRGMASTIRKVGKTGDRNLGKHSQILHDFIDVIARPPRDESLQTFCIEVEIPSVELEHVSLSPTQEPPELPLGR